MSVWLIQNEKAENPEGMKDVEGKHKEKEKRETKKKTEGDLYVVLWR